MNKTFDINRFCKYFIYDLKNARSNYGLTFLIVIAMPAILYMLSIILSLVFSGHWASPATGLRITFSIIACFIVCMSFPAQAYGKITDKKAGSAWLLLPASKFEKYLSMILITSILVPVLFVFGYGLTDLILSLVDPTYGTPLLGFDINGILESSNMPVSFAGNGFWLLFFSLSSDLLIFLMGAIFFKTKKVSKTILTLIALTIALSIASVSLDLSFDDDFIKANADKLNFAVNALIDIPLIIEYVILLVGIWFRTSTIKH